MPSPLPRRAVLALSGACAATGACVLAGCSGTSGASGAAPTTSTPPAPPASSAPPAPPASSAPAATGGAVLARLADVPVGGSLVVKGADGAPVALARPTAGTVVAHTAVCTHAGCTVGAAGARLACPCHGSVYEAATGAVLQGPAPRALAPVPVAVAGDAVVAGGA